MLPTAGSFQDMFDEEDTVLADIEHPEYGAIRLPDGRALAWAEYGSARGVPCILLPDAGSSRLAPRWLLHDSALPSSVRLLALDRPGTGASDPIGLGGVEDPAADLAGLVGTLAVGRVAVIAIGQGADDAFAFARRYPHLVASLSVVSARLSADPIGGRAHRGGGSSGSGRLRFRRAARPGATGAAPGAVGGWAAAAGADADLREESSWTAALPRMSPLSRAVLEHRWQEADFRAAVAADAAVGAHQWASIGKSTGRPGWLDDAGSVTVPVRLWHGQRESPTSLSDLRDWVAERTGWTVSAVAGDSATLGCWPQILACSAATFAATRAA